MQLKIDQLEKDKAQLLKEKAQWEDQRRILGIDDT